MRVHCRQIVITKKQFNELKETKSKSVYESGGIWFYCNGFENFELRIV
jgi:hypothetical protein